MSSKPNEGASPQTPCLQQAEVPVHYDVEAGLERHRALVAGGAAPPSWARVSPGMHWAPWLRRLAGLVVVGGVVVGARLLDRPAPQPTPAAPPNATTADVRPPEAAQGTPHAVVHSLAGAPAMDPTPAPPPLAPEVQPATTPGGAGHTASTGAAGAEDTAALERTPALEPQPARPLLDTERHRPTRTNDGDSPRPTPRSPAADSAGPVGVHPTTRAGGAGGEGDLHTQAPQDGEEIRQLVRARQLLPVDPLRALRLVRDGEARFDEGYLRQERRYLEVRALRALDRGLEADARAEWFIQDYPDSPYASEVRGKKGR